MSEENTAGTNSVSNEGASKNCVVCFENIHPKARRCTHCDSFQDWRRYINFSSTVLALLVALVSVLSISIPIIKDALTNPNSNVVLSFQSARADSIRIIASNTGEEAGSVVDRGFVCKEKMARLIEDRDEEVSFNTIRDYSLWGAENNPCLRLFLDRSKSGETAPDFLIPKDTKRLEFRYLLGVRIHDFLIDNEDADKRALILLQTIQFDGKRVDYIFRVPVNEFRD